MFKQTPAILFIAFITVCPAATGQTPEGTVLKVCIIPDKSLSGRQFETPPLLERHFYPLFEQLLITGGELGLGTLDEDSNAFLKRFYVPPLKPLPERQTSFNKRKALQLEQQYQMELRKWIAHRDDRRDTFQVEKEIFLDLIQDDLKDTLYAKESDLAGALIRCSRFLAEIDAEMSGLTVINFILFISDVEHAVRRGRTNIDTTIPKPYELEATMNIFVVNGRKHKGTLAQAGYHVTAFEAVDPAIRALVSSSKSGRWSYGR